MSILYVILACVELNPLTPRSDEYINSPYNFYTVKQRGDKNLEDYQLGDIVWIYSVAPNSQD